MGNRGMVMLLILACGLAALTARAAETSRVPARQWQGVALGQAVAELFAGRAEQGIALPDVATYPLTATLGEMTLASAVDVIARAARVEVRQEGSLYLFTRRPESEPPEPTAELLREGERLSLRFVRFPAKRAVALLAPHTGRKLGLDEALATARLTLLWEGARDAAPAVVARALDAIAVQNSDHTVQIAPLPERLRVEGSKERVTVDLRRAPLRRAAGALARLLGMDLVWRAGVPNVPVTLSLRDVPAETALQMLARWANAVAPEGVALKLADGVATVGLPSQLGGAAGRVSADLLDVPLRQALRLLFQGTGFQFAVEPEVPDVPITLSVTNLDLLAALRAVVQLAAAQQPRITFRKEGDLYIVGLRRG